MEVYIYPLLKRLDKKGVVLIVCRVSHSLEIRDEFRTGIFIAPENWDKLRGFPIVNEQSISARLNNISNELYKIIASKKLQSPTLVIQEYKRQNNQVVTTSNIKIFLLNTAKNIRSQNAQKKLLSVL